jgi:hypothetical protein
MHDMKAIPSITRSLEPASNVTLASCDLCDAIGPKKQHRSIDSTDGGMQIDSSDLHKAKVRGSRRDNCDPGSKTISSTSAACRNESADNVVTDAGTVILFALGSHFQGADAPEPSIETDDQKTAGRSTFVSERNSSNVPMIGEYSPHLLREGDR